MGLVGCGHAAAPGTDDPGTDSDLSTDHGPGPGGGTGDSEQCDGHPTEWVGALDVPAQLALSAAAARDGTWQAPGRLFDGTPLTVSWVLSTDVAGAWHQYATPKPGFSEEDCDGYWRVAFESQITAEGLGFTSTHTMFMTLPGDTQRYSAAMVERTSWPAAVALPDEVLQLPGRAATYILEAYLREDGTIDGHLRQYGSETDPETGDQVFFDLFTFDGHL